MSGLFRHTTLSMMLEDLPHGAAQGMANPFFADLVLGERSMMHVRFAWHDRKWEGIAGPTF